MSILQGFRAFWRQLFGPMPKVGDCFEWDYDEPINPFELERKFARITAVKGGYVQFYWHFEEDTREYLDSMKADFFRFCYKPVSSAQQNEEAARGGEQQNSAEGK